MKNQDLNFWAGPHPVPVIPGTWHHIVGTWDGVPDPEHVVLYIDGKEILSERCSSEPLPGPRQPNDMRFGAPSNDLSQYLFGELDDIRIYNRVLSEAEIQALFQE